VSDFSALVGREDIQAVAIATPQDTHRDLTVEAFQHGKHVFCEKPLARTVAQCDDMIAAAEGAGRTLIVGQQMRYHYFLQKIADLIQDDVIGKPIMLWLKEMRGPFRVSPEHMWIFDRERSGGMLVEKSCHHFDLFNWYAGSRPVSVYASGGQDVFHELAGVRSSICDNAWVIVNYESGARAVLGLGMFLGRSHPQEGGIGTHRRDIGVAGEKGMILQGGALPQDAVEIHSSQNRDVTRIQMDPKGTRPTPFNQHGEVGIFMDFAACIREGRRPFASGDAGRLALAVSLAAEQSIDERRVVALSEICDIQ
jgi:predicted dehydrogenase